MPTTAAPAIDGATHRTSGKVRDLYDLPDGRLLMVASDRISAFDFVLESTIPDKGAVLTRMSLWWFDRLAALVPNHVLSTDVPAEVAGRAVVCEPLAMHPVECVARGYLTGSGLIDYQKTGKLCGIALPPGLSEASKFTQPVFTPATKAELGQHDENISFNDVIDLVGAIRANQLRERTLQTYLQGADHALTKGIIVADTKFEFGVDNDGNLRLADEVFTPDSSRYWRADDWQEGVVQNSFDKQFVRNWLTGPESGWNRHGDKPPPALPPDIVDATRARYIEAYERISGHKFIDWIKP